MPLFLSRHGCDGARCYHRYTYSDSGFLCLGRHWRYLHNRQHVTACSASRYPQRFYYWPLSGISKQSDWCGIVFCWLSRHWIDDQLEQLSQRGWPFCWIWMCLLKCITRKSCIVRSYMNSAPFKVALTMLIYNLWDIWETTINMLNSSLMKPSSFTEKRISGKDDALWWREHGGKWDSLGWGSFYAWQMRPGEALANLF